MYSVCTRSFLLLYFLDKEGEITEENYVLKPRYQIHLTAHALYKQVPYAHIPSLALLTEKVTFNVALM